MDPPGETFGKDQFRHCERSEAIQARVYDRWCNVDIAGISSVASGLLRFARNDGGRICKGFFREKATGRADHKDESFPALDSAVMASRRRSYPVASRVASGMLGFARNDGAISSGLEA